MLTGITQGMVAGAPRIDSALAAFLDFARDTVLVAHNAPFDLGFLKAACTATGRDWPDFDSIDTARLARRVLTRDEAPNCKLSTQSQIFSLGVLKMCESPVTPAPSSHFTNVTPTSIPV